MLDKLAYEDAREYQIAMEHARAQRNARDHNPVLSLEEELAQEAHDAWLTFRHHKAGIFTRWVLRSLGL